MSPYRSCVTLYLGKKILSYRYCILYILYKLHIKGLPIIYPFSPFYINIYFVSLYYVIIAPLGCYRALLMVSPSMEGCNVSFMFNLNYLLLGYFVFIDFLPITSIWLLIYALLNSYYYSFICKIISPWNLVLFARLLLRPCFENFPLPANQVTSVLPKTRIHHWYRKVEVKPRVLH